MSYAELFCQSNFSFLQGASHPEELALQASFFRYQALAITDECSVAGVVRAHRTIKEHNLPLKLIVGSYFKLADELRVLLLCPNRQAYAELCRIITNSRRRANKGEYELSQWDLATIKHCFFIWLPCYKSSSKENNNRWAGWLNKHHGDRLWIGLQRHLTGVDHRYRRYCEKFSEVHQIPICACGGVLMHSPERLPLQHALTAIRLGQGVSECGRKLESNAERALRPLHKLKRIFRPEWIKETLLITQQCQFNLDELRYEYPAELIPPGKTPMQHLRDLVEEGVQRRFPDGISPALRITLEHELKLIDEMAFAFFFLTIHDIVMFAKRQEILYQGRGSSANSIVCYCLEITAVDPCQISLLFERFISKERNEPPDIDVDFEHERREEVIQYVYQKYGRERAALAASVRTYRLKSAIREVGKALGIGESQLDFYIKNINRRDKTLRWQNQIVELGLDPESDQGRHFISLVQEIIGFPRHLSQHVGGFVISSGPLYELVPVENAAMQERTVIQWDKDDLESLGLLKVDILALGMLSAIRKAFDLIKTDHGRQLSIAEITRNQDDANVYRLIQKADTVGIFQIESRAQMSMLPRLKPASYYDLVIQIAIVRPGPIQGDMVHPYLKRRNGEEAVEYPSEAVKDVLERTLGVPIFQEQVIKLAMVAAGFSGGEADRLRRAMASWKKTGELTKFRSKLVNGMKERGYDGEFAERIYQQICGFGEYGFPESHSASFAVLAYVSAWLKYYYPTAFYVSLLNSLPMGFYSPSQLIQDARRHAVRVLPVCVNQSQYDHIQIQSSDHPDLRLGMRIVKGLSEEAVEKIIGSRPSVGYRSINQLKEIGLKRNELEALAGADALSDLAENRYLARWQMMERNSELPLFTESERLIKNRATDLRQPDEIETLVEDYASLGLTLNKHPITLLDQAGELTRFTRMRELIDKSHKSLVSVVGVVTGRQAPGTASGVTFFTLEDDTGNINVVVWAGTARAQKKAYMTARILRVNGILEREGEVIHVIAGKLIDQSNKINRLGASSRDFH